MGFFGGIAIISCSPYIFIPLVVNSLALGAVGISVYIGYALGLGLPILVIAILISLGRKGIVTEFVKLAPKLNKLTGVILTIVGSSLLLFDFVLRPYLNLSFDAFNYSLLTIIVVIVLISLIRFKGTGDKSTES